MAGDKAFDLGIIVGRFQVLHKGHGYMIRKAQAVCSELAIFVGSSQESGTLKNPLSYEMRAKILKEAFPGITVYPLPDIGVGNTYSWGEYVLENVKKNCGRLPDLTISGYESRRTSWLEEKWNIAQLIVPKIIDISATKMIQYIIDGDQQTWNRFIEPAIISMYGQIREVVLQSRDKLETMSI